MSFIVGNDYRISQRYLEHTNILSTLFEATEGAFEVIDFMPRYKLLDYDYYLPPELYRLIRLKRGTPRFRVNYNPALNYARGEVGHKTGPEYVKTYAKANERDTIYLYSGIPYDVIFNQQEVLLQRDEFLLVSYNQKLIPIDMNRVNLEFQRTRLYWMNWTNRSKKYTAFNEQIERSMLVLKLMSYQRSGAVLAALTTSLPESIGEVRNWDYRFCWLRDASMSIETLVKVGHRGAAERFIAFITGILHSKYDRFQIMYGIRGERVLTEYDLPHLAGYKNSKPVRVGNDAYHQMQNDSFGYLMDVIYQYYLYFPGTLDEIEDMFEVVKNIVRTVMEDWRKPDKGIWEIRGDEKHFVLSKVMCWVALDRAQGECFWLNNGHLQPERLQKGIFGLSNAELNTPWPKVVALKARLKAAISASPNADDLANSLFTALSDPSTAPDEDLPHTGLTPEWEKMLSAAFIKSPEMRYGTRASTVIITERVNKRVVTHVWERTFSSNSTVALMRRVTLKNWPPRHTMDGAEVARLSASLPPSFRTEDRFESSEVHEDDNHDVSTDAPVRKARARSLIKNSPIALKGE